MGRVNIWADGKISFAGIQTLPDSIELNTYVINPGNFNQHTNYHRVKDSRMGVPGIVHTVRFANCGCNSRHPQDLVQGERQ